MLFGVALGLSLLGNITSYKYLLTISNEAEELAISYTELSAKYIKKIQDIKSHFEATELQQNQKDYQIKKLQLAAEQAELRAKDIQNQLTSQKKLEILSNDGKETNRKLQEMLRLSQASLDETQKQMELLAKANSTLNEEVQRLRFMQSENAQQTALPKKSIQSGKEQNWTTWISSEDANTFCRENISNKNMIPLEIEGKVTGSGILYRFFLIPNLYQLRWRAEWGLTDDALVRQVSYHGKYKYFELSRQSFMVNSTSPRYQVIFMHNLDMDEAKRLREKYFTK